MRKLTNIKIKTEQRVAQNIHWHPNVISSLKLLLSIPIILLLIFPESLSGYSAYTIMFSFIVFGMLDYLDGVIAKHHDKETVFGRYYDRLTDYPLLLVLGYLAIDMVPVTLIALKVFLDAILLYLYARHKFYSYNRLRTGIHYLTLFILLINALHINAPILNTQLAANMLALSSLVNSIIIAIHFGWIKKKYIADSLSFANLLCGVIVIYMAYQGKLELSILFLLIGALFDGLDGFAARKFGSTRFGVLSDDIADGFTYGVAPAIALMIHFYQIDENLLLDGLIIGCIYIVFTISRLVYFTLNKENADPNYFLGAPSTLGGIIVLSSCYIFKDHVTLIALFIGIASILMVSLTTQYRHIGRLFQSIQLKRRLLVPAILLVLSLIVLKQSNWLIISLFCIVLGYGLAPIVLIFKRLGKNEPTADSNKQA